MPVFQLASSLNGMPFNAFNKFGIPALRIRHSGVQHSGPAFGIPVFGILACSFADRLSGKFATNLFLSIPPHVKYDTTLPCEISGFKKSDYSRSN